MIRRFGLWSCLTVFAMTACGGGDDDPVNDASNDGGAVAPVTSASPLGGTFRATPDVTLTANEAATIYYTTDGSEPTTSSTSGPSPVVVSDVPDGTVLRFFAVDSTGDSEVAPNSETYGIDRFGPVPVDAVKATATGTDVALTWDNPTASGFATVVVARVTDVAATTPTDGEVPAVGDTIDGAQVVYVGNAETFTDAGLAPGGFTYVAWALYDNGVFSDGRPAATRVAAGAQTGALTLNVDAQTVTVNTQPSQFTLATSNVAFSAGTLTFDLAVTPKLEGLTFNPNVALKDFSVGTFSNSDATFTFGDNTGLPFKAFGPQPIPKNTAVTRSISVSGLVAGNTATFNASITQERGLIASEWSQQRGLRMMDFGSGLASANLSTSPPGWTKNGNPSNPAYRGVRISPDGRYVYAGARQRPRIDKIDLVTGTVVGGVDLTIAEAHGSVVHTVMDPSGHRLYAVLNDGMHSGASRGAVESYLPGETPARPKPLTNTVFVVEIDLATMAETQRLQVYSGDITKRGRRLAMSPNGRTLALPVGGQYLAVAATTMHVLDLSPFTERDFDAATEGSQGLSTGALRSSQAAFSYDGSKLVFNSSWEGDDCEWLGVVDLDAEAPEATLYDTNTETTCGEKAVAFDARPDGTFWVTGDMTGLASFDPATGTMTKAGAVSRDGMAIRDAGDNKVLLLEYRQVNIVDATTGETLQELELGSSTYNHEVIVTPF